MKKWLEAIVGVGSALVGAVLSVSVLCIVYAIPISIVGLSYLLYGRTAFSALAAVCCAVLCFVAMGCVDAICARAAERWGRGLLFRTVRIGLDFICAWASYSLLLHDNVSLMAALLLSIVMEGPVAASFTWEWVSRIGSAIAEALHHRRSV